MKKTTYPPKPPTLAEVAKLERQKKDKQRAELIQLVARGSVTQVEAAGTLGITDRQVRRLLTSYNEGGTDALLHKARGKPSNHQLDQNLHTRVLELIRSKYTDSGPRLISEELSLMHDIPSTPRPYGVG